MTYQLSNFRQQKQLTLNLSARQKNFFLKGFWVVCALSLYVILTADADFLTILAALLISVAALYPSYLWCCDRARGLPLFPLLSMSYLFTHGFALVSDNINVRQYSPSQHFISALIVASFLIVATFTWTFYAQKAAIKPRAIKEFSTTQVFPFFTSALILRIIYQIGINSGYLWLIVPGSVISLLRAMTGSTSFLAVIIISYLLGKKLVNKMQAFFFLSLMIILLFVSGASLYLNIIGSYLLLAMIGWMLGSNKIPWRLLLVSILIMTLLNIGKADTRHYYWTIRDSAIQPTEYIQLYKDWFDNSLKNIQQSKSEAEHQKNEGSLIHRSSVVHMLLKVQTETGIQRPYLWGKTYSLIPQLLVPRFFNSNKIRGGEANHLLSVHYGLQSYGQTQTTSIGWGILQEAYANFGWLGCWGLGIFIGSLYGWITRWSMNVSCLSFRFLVASIFMILTLRSEVTMGTFISVTFQSLVILTAIRMFFMKTVSVNNKCQNLL